MDTILLMAIYALTGVSLVVFGGSYEDQGKGLPERSRSRRVLMASLETLWAATLWPIHYAHLGAKGLLELLKKL